MFKISHNISLKMITNIEWVGGVSERHSGTDYDERSEKTNGRCERFHDRELPLPTQKPIMGYMN